METKHVYTAINAVQKALCATGISKDRTNQHQRYKFRGIDDVFNALSPALADAGLVIMPRVDERTATTGTTSKGAIQYHVVLKVNYDLVSCKDGSIHCVSAYGEGMDTSDKATNKAFAAAYKYMALQTFCVPVEGQDDADSHSPQQNAHTPAPAPVGPCTQAQSTELVKLLEATGVDMTAFLKHYKVNSLQEMTTTSADHAIATLKKRLDK